MRSRLALYVGLFLLISDSIFVMSREPLRPAPAAAPGELRAPRPSRRAGTARMSFPVRRAAATAFRRRRGCDGGESSPQAGWAARTAPLLPHTRHRNTASRRQG